MNLEVINLNIIFAVILRIISNLHIMIRIIPYKIVVFIFICIEVSSTFAFAQNHTIDNLESKLNKHDQIDTSKVNLLNQLAYELFTYDAKRSKTYADQSLKMALELNYPQGEATALYLVGMSTSKKDPQLALTYYKQGLQIAQQINDQSRICSGWLNIGVVNKVLGNLDASNSAYEQALAIAIALKDQSQQIKLRYNISINRASMGQYSEAVEGYQKIINMADTIEDKSILVQCYSSMGTIFQRQGNSAQALEYYLSALKINEQADKKPNIITNLINIAGVQSDLQDSKTALENLQRAEKLANELNDSVMIAYCLTNIGNVYKNIKHPEALLYLTKALEMVGDKKNEQRINLLMNIASIEIEKGEFLQADKNLNEAFELSRKAKIKYSTSQVLNRLGQLYYIKKEFGRAINYTKESLQVSSEINYLEVKKNNYQLLSDIYAATDNYKEAYHHHVLFKQLQDTLFNDENVRRLALMESAYKYDKEKQKYELEKITQQLRIKSQHYFILFLIIVLLLIIILSYQFYLSNRLKKKALKLEIEQINSQLEYSKKEMATATLKLIQNSESDGHCMRILKNIKNKMNEEGEKDVHSLINYYQNKSLYTNWEEFETLFLKVNSNFYEKLNEYCPTLTRNERKLCVFLKLNMSNKDIAQITFQSEEALKKARMRLRKKLQMEHDDSLITFAQNL